MHFVGDDRIIYRLSGYDPQRISTHAIEYAPQGATYHRGFVYTQEGHKFYGLWTDSGTFLMTWRPVHGTNVNRSAWASGAWAAHSSSMARPILPITRTGTSISPSRRKRRERRNHFVQVELPTIECGDRSRITMHSFEVLCETG